MSALKAAMSDDPERRRRIRRTAIVLAIVALSFYFGFILMSVLRAGH